MRSMDNGYLETSKVYISQWMEELSGKGLKITEEAMEYMIEKGGNGLCDLEKLVRVLVDTAIEYRIEEITKDYVEIVLSK